MSDYLQQHAMHPEHSWNGCKQQVTLL